MVTPPDPPKMNLEGQSIKALSAEDQAKVVANARDFSGRSQMTAREIYAIADVNGDGNLDRYEVQSLLKEKYAFDISQDTLDQIFAIYDKDTDGHLNIDEFEDFVSTNIVDGVLALHLPTESDLGA